MLSVDKAEVVIDIVEMVNVTLPAASNETTVKTKAELKAEAKKAKQVRTHAALPSVQVLVGWCFQKRNEGSLYVAASFTATLL